jgi:hypothetical protein
MGLKPARARRTGWDFGTEPSHRFHAMVSGDVSKVEPRSVPKGYGQSQTELTAMGRSGSRARRKRRGMEG